MARGELADPRWSARSRAPGRRPVSSRTRGTGPAMLARPCASRTPWGCCSANDPGWCSSRWGRARRCPGWRAGIPPLRTRRWCWPRCRHVARRRATGWARIVRSPTRGRAAWTSTGRPSMADEAGASRCRRIRSRASATGSRTAPCPAAGPRAPPRPRRRYRPRGLASRSRPRASPGPGAT